ncbi:MAG: hypothetical protein U0T73_03950 [Chitinophagales bacterium]
MKNAIFTLIFAVMASSGIFAQGAVPGNDLVVYGIDFTKAKFIGPEGFSNPTDLKERFFEGWNMLLVNERDKYPVGPAFRKVNVRYEFDAVREKNATVDPAKLVTYNSSDAVDLTPADLQRMVSGYKKSGSTGPGLVFVVQAFDKVSEVATVHLVFFDLATGKLITTRKMTAAPGGFGVKNYWASCFAKILDKAKKEYPTWSK